MTAMAARTGQMLNYSTVAEQASLDLLIESDGTIYPVEIKLSANPKLAMTNSFDVVDKIAGNKRGTGVVICRYPRRLWLNESTAALPVEYI